MTDQSASTVIMLCL